MQDYFLREQLIDDFKNYFIESKILDNTSDYLSSILYNCFNKREQEYIVKVAWNKAKIEYFEKYNREMEEG